MNLDQIKEILELVQKHELAEFEIEHEGLRLRVRKDGGLSGVVPVFSAPPAHAGSAAAVPQPALAASAGTTSPVPAEPTDQEIELAVVKSPIVGTFYRSAEPNAPPFVEIGSAVKKGQVLCIIEAMKLMNEIDSEYDGEVVNVYVENGQPVQYGERLFAIRTT
jgi:acetyl-CoA carboxylase biotin carboxyl carrier protein